MKKINKKGFTLVELLAVIVLLGIVATALAARVFATMNNSKSRTFVTTFNDIQKQVMADYMIGQVITGDGKEVLEHYDLNEKDYVLKVEEYGTGGYKVTLTAAANGSFNSMSKLEKEKEPCTNISGLNEGTKCSGKQISNVIETGNE